MLIKHFFFHFFLVHLQNNNYNVIFLNKNYETDKYLSGMFLLHFILKLTNNIFNCLLYYIQSSLFLIYV